MDTTSKFDASSVGKSNPISGQLFFKLLNLLLIFILTRAQHEIISLN